MLCFLNLKAVNKTSNCVFLRHVPTNIFVKVHAERSLAANRKIARQLLTLKLDNFYNGKLSKQNLEAEKMKKRKAKSRQRAKKKHQATQNDQKDDEDMDDEDDVFNAVVIKKKRNVKF